MNDLTPPSTNQQNRLTFEEILNFTEITNIQNIRESSNSNEDIMCSICRNNIQENEPLRKIKNCGHYFHLNCIDNWLLTNNTCPLCRCNITEVNEANQDEGQPLNQPIRNTQI